ncbi:DOMON-like domain-containing protein [Propionivibrio limicola]|uniref:DOMON-like domain-containing protein n=1 Tax=Propionivibrio limicola TaxID=167645 RepID=UPI001292109D|nr:DOMON-like domain-containing protein [Propionivibrio limicola]
MPDEHITQPLFCHIATPAPTVRAIEVRLSQKTGNGLTLGYTLWGDATRLRIPQQQLPSRSDGLWEHTCFEAFIGLRGERAYREFNFSPSGQWAAYAFSDYRQHADTSPDFDPLETTTRLLPDRFELEVCLPYGALPANPDGKLWQIGLSAVIETHDTNDGQLSYWALHHPSAKPDFHHRDAFVLELPSL